MRGQERRIYFDQCTKMRQAHPLDAYSAAAYGCVGARTSVALAWRFAFDQAIELVFDAVEFGFDRSPLCFQRRDA